MSNKYILCDLCEARVFSQTAFPGIFVGEDLDEAEGIKFRTSRAELGRSISQSCTFCALILYHILTGKAGVQTEDEASIDVWIYAVPLSGSSSEQKPSYDISKLFIEAAPHGRSSYMVFAEKGRSTLSLAFTR